MGFNLNGVQKDTWIRTVLLIIALVNQGLRYAGLETLPFSEAEISDGLSYGAIVVMALVGWWKNNSFTLKAQQADKVLKGE